jgi:F-type H+-transporting ATPase subunit a
VKYVGNFIKIGPLLKARNIKDVLMGILDLFLGVMDIISELAKIISVSARLFGNVIAGEIIAVVILFLVPYIIPIPFFILSLFSGLIQAFVFALLSMQFIA